SGNAARPYEEKPPTADSPSVKGVRNADGSWTFDITAIASQWASGSLANNGIALRPDPGATGATFQVVWSGNSPPPTTSGEIVPAAGTSSSDTGTSSSDTGTFAPSDTGAPAPVAVEPDFATPVTTPTQTAPTVTPPTAAPRTATRVSSSRRTGPNRAAPAAFFLAAVAVIALLAA